MTIARKTNVVVDACSRFIPNLWGKPRIAAFTWAIASEIQELEDAIWDSLLIRLIDNATGIYLATLGKIVGQPNLGAPPWPDDLYRLFILARIRANRSLGRIKDLLEIAELLAPLVNGYANGPYNDVGFASFEIYVDSPYYQAIRDILDYAAGGGIDVRVHSVTPAGAGFVLDTLTGTNPAGLSTIIGTGGGFLAKTATP